MDALGELAAAALELVIEVLPFRTATVIVLDVAVIYLAAKWVADNQPSALADWVAVGAFLAMPVLSVVLLMRHRRLVRKMAALRAEPAHRITVSPARPRRR